MKIKQIDKLPRFPNATQMEKKINKFVSRLSSLEERIDILFKLIQANKKFQQTWDMYAFGEFENLEKRTSEPKQEWCQCKVPKWKTAIFSVPVQPKEECKHKNTYEDNILICADCGEPVKTTQPKEDTKELWVKIYRLIQRDRYHKSLSGVKLTDKIIALIK